MLGAIVVIVTVGGITLWIVSVQQKLAILNDNSCNAMSQIGVQLSSRFDALTALFYLTKHYAKAESETFIETIQLSRCTITAKSTPKDVLRQEAIMTEALEKITLLTIQYPELTTNETFNKTMDAIQAYGTMIRTSRLIYNESVKALNKELRLFPVVLVAKIIGFSQKEYLSM